MDRAKQELRRRLRRRRADRAAGADGPLIRRDEADLLLAVARAAGALDPLGRPGMVGPMTVAAYLASPGEPEVAALTGAVRAAGGRVLLPVPGPGRVLAWACDDDRHVLVPGLGVRAPAGPALGTGAACLLAEGVRLVLAPALAVDAGGTRLGQGGGYYDVLLAELAAMGGGPRVLAVVHDDEVLPAGAIPHDAHDVPVRAALTRSGIRMLG